VRQWAAARLGGKQAAEEKTARLALKNGIRSLLDMRRLTTFTSQYHSMEIGIHRVSGKRQVG
jgi:hypothetical protein